MMRCLAFDVANEEWRPIPGLHGYDASSLGRIRSWWVRDVGGPKGARVLGLHPKALRATQGRGGYFRLIVGRGEHRAMRTVHCMVLEAFSGPRPLGKVACHNDGDPSNNRPDNLRWDTPAANTADMMRHGKHDPHRGASQKTAKLSDNLVREIRSSSGKISQGAWAEKIGCSPALIGQVRRGEKWSHVPQ